MASKKEQTNSFFYFLTSLARFVFIVFIILYLVLFLLDILFGGLIDQTFSLWVILLIIIISGVVSIFHKTELKDIKR